MQQGPPLSFSLFSLSPNLLTRWALRTPRVWTGRPVSSGSQGRRAPSHSAGPGSSPWSGPGGSPQALHGLVQKHVAAGEGGLRLDTVKHYRVIGQSVEQKQTFKLQFKITSSL